MSIAVTGSTGHLGANVVRQLLDRGHRVRALHHPEAKLDALEGLEVERVSVDVLDYENLRSAFVGCRWVVNLAALISIDGDRDGLVMKTNVLGPRNVSLACLDVGVKKLVHVSSVHAFVSPGPHDTMDECAPRPTSNNFIYDQSKALGEEEIRASVNNGLDAVILNPTGILGPHDYNNSFSGQMLNNFFDGSLPVTLNLGFDWVDARDVACAVETALVSGRTGENYLLPGNWVSMKDLASCCAKVSGARPPHFVLPIWMAQAALPVVKGVSFISGTAPLFTSESLMILRDSCRNIDGTKAKHELDFRARPLTDTIRDIYQWKRYSKLCK